jgi:predicted aminopeptidase
MTQAITRYVVTHVGRDGLRTLASAAQGRYTYATYDEAQAHLDALLEHNSPERLREVYGLPLEVRACNCWPVHFDPMGVYFD